MRVSEAILKYLKLHEVEYVFGIPGGSISPLYDMLNDIDFKLIVSKNEAASTYCAARYASISQKLGVCFLAGGVGVNNGVNGIADAMIEKSPMLIISGFIKTQYMGKGAMQELDTQDILRPITKYSKTVFNKNEVLSELEEAIQLALTPPFGPVHISIPMDIQLQEFEGKFPQPAKLVKTPIDYDSLHMAEKIINQSSKGLIFVGKGSRFLTDKIEKLSEHLSWPIITSSGGKGVISEDFHMNLGNYGFSGTDSANDFISQGDYSCILILGSSLGENDTRTFNDILVRNKSVIHIDSDIRELNRVFDAEVAVCGDLGGCIDSILKNTEHKPHLYINPKIYNKPYELNHTGLSFRLFVEKITEFLPKNSYFVCDMGETLNFLFKYLMLPRESNFEMNLSYACMGSSLGGAVGAQLAVPHMRTVVTVGDGSFFMNGMEILSAKEQNLPIIYIVANNAKLGYVDTGHKYLYNRTRPEFRQPRVSICQITKAMGIPSIEINSIEDMDQIPSLIADDSGPCVIELIIDGTEPSPAKDRLKALENSDKR